MAKTTLAADDQPDDQSETTGNKAKADATATAEAEHTRKLSRIVAKHVMKICGKPPLFTHIAIKPLWADRYFRVNIYTTHLEKADELFLPNLHITDSYFITTNDDGTIEHSNPKLHRKYA